LDASWAWPWLAEKTAEANRHRIFRRFRIRSPVDTRMGRKKLRKDAQMLQKLSLFARQLALHQVGNLFLGRVGSTIGPTALPDPKMNPQNPKKSHIYWLFA
jgi:hypothetical protein